MQISPQIISKISSTSSALIILPGGNADSLAAGLAFSAFLKKLEKDVEILSFTSRHPQLNFLQGFDGIKEKFDTVKSFVIDISTKKTLIDELSYKKDIEKLSIFIKPKKGQFSSEDVSFRSSAFPYDLVILIGVDSLERLGEVYSQNTELFFETPVLNVDYKSTNESYAQFNLINLAATSNSEIIFDLISQFEANFIDEAMATQLLAGIISETNSFQHVRTTPQTFLKASQLVSLGANQQEIISRLYKSKSLGLLKLWGRVLAKLKQETEISLVYSSISVSEILQSGASREDADKIIFEMSSQLGFAKLFLFIKEEQAGKVLVYFHSSLPMDVKTVLKKYNPDLFSPQIYTFIVNSPMEEAEKQIIEDLKTEINKLKLT